MSHSLSAGLCSGAVHDLTHLYDRDLIITCFHAPSSSLSLGCWKRSGMAKMLFLDSLSLTCILFFMPCNKLRQSCLLWYSYRAQAKCSKAVCDGCYVDERNTNAMLTYTNGYMHATVFHPAAFIHSARQGAPWIKLFCSSATDFGCLDLDIRPRFCPSCPQSGN